MSISSVPCPAYIYINGVFHGTTPVRLKLEEFKLQKTHLTAIPMVTSQYRQDVTVREGMLPAEVLFYMDYPPTENATLPVEEDLAGDHANFQLVSPPVLYFGIDLYQLTPKHLQQLEPFSQRLVDSSLKQVSIYGFADERHTNNYNVALSLNRAKAAAKELVRLGVSAEQIRIYALGETNIRNSELRHIEFKGNRKVNFEIQFQPKNKDVKNN